MTLSDSRSGGKPMDRQLYYEKMSELLDALIKERKEEALAYEKYLAEIV